MSLTIQPIAPGVIPLLWDKLEPILQRVIEKAPDDLCIDSMYNKAVNGDSILIAITDKSEVIAVNIVEVEQYATGKKVLLIPITGGDRMEEWLDEFLVLAEQLARTFKCEAFRGFSCRPGWLRALNKGRADNDKWFAVHEVIEYKFKETP